MQKDSNDADNKADKQNISCAKGSNNIASVRNKKIGGNRRTIDSRRIKLSSTSLKVEPFYGLLTSHFCFEG